MPNHVINILRFPLPTAADVEKIRKAVLKPDGTLCFSVLLPVPLNVWPFDVDQVHDKHFATGNALDWCRTNWGTKWGPYHDPVLRETLEGVELEFQTAWAPPRPWALALFQTVGISFDHLWLTEGEEWGYREEWRCAPPARSWAFKHWEKKPCSDEEQKRLHLALWGCERFDNEDDEEDKHDACSE